MPDFYNPPRAHADAPRVRAILQEMDDSNRTPYEKVLELARRLAAAERELEERSEGVDASS